MAINGYQHPYAISGTSQHQVALRSPANRYFRPEAPEAARLAVTQSDLLLRAPEFTDVNPLILTDETESLRYVL
jgi:hypothetical protein